MTLTVTNLSHILLASDRPPPARSRCRDPLLSPVPPQRTSAPQFLPYCLFSRARKSTPAQNPPPDSAPRAAPIVAESRAYGSSAAPRSRPGDPARGQEG